MSKTREIHLVRRPNGILALADFSVAEANVPATGDGEVKVQTLIMSVDPYMRTRLNADQALNAPLLGGGHRARGGVAQSEIPGRPACAAGCGVSRGACH